MRTTKRFSVKVGTGVDVRTRWQGRKEGERDRRWSLFRVSHCHMMGRMSAHTTHSLPLFLPLVWLLFLWKRGKEGQTERGRSSSSFSVNDINITILNCLPSLHEEPSRQSGHRDHLTGIRKGDTISLIHTWTPRVDHGHSLGDWVLCWGMGRGEHSNTADWGGCIHCSWCRFVRRFWFYLFRSVDIFLLHVPCVCFSSLSLWYICPFVFLWDSCSPKWEEDEWETERWTEGWTSGLILVLREEEGTQRKYS